MIRKASALKLHFRIDHPAWKKERVKLRALAKEASAAVCAPDGVGVSLVLSTDAALQQLNHDFRGKNKPTNVLSFAAGDGDEPGYLGDIIVSLDTVEKEAAAQGKSVPHHLCHLIVHGLLHLLGHDHEKEPDATRMEGLEVEILRKINIPNPYL